MTQDTASKKEEEKELFASGHRGCAGCGEMNAVRQVLAAAGPNTIVANATGCLEVATTSWPETAWEIPWVHAAFENAAAVASGVDAALTQMKRRQGINLFAFAGDGGTFDIGFQAISGMLERQQKVIFVVFDNEAYMNTGIQRCSSTPYGASTTTCPAGTCSIGESKPKKPMAMIVAAHGIKYTATATIGYHADLKRKVKRACELEGPCFIHVLAPCPTGWRHDSADTIAISRLAVDTGMFVLWELEGHNLKDIKLSRKPKERKPVLEYLKTQGRFRHLLKQPEVLAKIQKDVDEQCAQFGF